MGGGGGGGDLVKKFTKMLIKRLRSEGAKMNSDSELHNIVWRWDQKNGAVN